MVASPSAQCRHTLSSLKNLYSLLEVSKGPESESLERKVLDELERFTLWVGNTGAAHGPQSPLSLESRLQEASEVFEFISTLLEDLSEVARERESGVPRKRGDTDVPQVSDIASGERAVGLPTAPSEKPDESSPDETTELLREIGACITRLFGITSLVHQAGSTDPFAKAYTRSRYQFADQYDIAHVGEKYPKLATAGNAWLRIRLGSAITQRRRFLSYIRDHLQKLEVENEYDDVPNIVIEEPQSARELFPGILPEPIPSKQLSTTMRDGPGLLSSLMTQQKPMESDAISFVTMSRSINGDVDTSAISRIPKLDDLRTENKEFACPFCYRVEKIRNERVWRRHVFSDLRSYVCTFQFCNSPYFSDVNDWFRHELRCHRVHYKCHVCSGRTFEHGNICIAHVQENHPELFSGGDEQQILDMARSPLDHIRARDCPCCSEWADRLEERANIFDISSDTSDHTVVVEQAVFKRHLASHLEQLALFAVPSQPAEDDTWSGAAIEGGSDDFSLGVSSLAFTDCNPSAPSSNSTSSVDTT